MSFSDDGIINGSKYLKSSKSNRRRGGIGARNLNDTGAIFRVATKYRKSNYEFTHKDKDNTGSTGELHKAPSREIIFPAKKANIKRCMSERLSRKPNFIIITEPVIQEDDGQSNQDPDDKESDSSVFEDCQDSFEQSNANSTSVQIPILKFEAFESFHKTNKINNSQTINNLKKDPRIDNNPRKLKNQNEKFNSQTLLLETIEQRRKSCRKQKKLTDLPVRRMSTKFRSLDPETAQKVSVTRSHSRTGSSSLVSITPILYDVLGNSVDNSISIDANSILTHRDHQQELDIILNESKCPGIYGNHTNLTRNIRNPHNNKGKKLTKQPSYTKLRREKSKKRNENVILGVDELKFLAQNNFLLESPTCTSSAPEDLGGQGSIPIFRDQQVAGSNSQSHQNISTIYRKTPFVRADTSTRDTSKSSNMKGFGKKSKSVSPKKSSRGQSSSPTKSRSKDRESVRDRSTITKDEKSLYIPRKSFLADKKELQLLANDNFSIKDYSTDEDLFYEIINDKETYASNTELEFSNFESTNRQSTSRSSLNSRNSRKSLIHIIERTNNNTSTSHSINHSLNSAGASPSQTECKSSVLSPIKNSISKIEQLNQKMTNYHAYRSQRNNSAHSLVTNKQSVSKTQITQTQITQTKPVVQKADQNLPQKVQVVQPSSKSRSLSPTKSFDSQKSHSTQTSTIVADDDSVVVSKAELATLMQAYEQYKEIISNQKVEGSGPSTSSAQENLRPQGQYESPQVQPSSSTSAYATSTCGTSKTRQQEARTKARAAHQACQSSYNKNTSTGPAGLSNYVNFQNISNCKINTCQSCNELTPHSYKKFKNSTVLLNFYSESDEFLSSTEGGVSSENSEHQKSTPSSSSSEDTDEFRSLNSSSITRLANQANKVIQFSSSSETLNGIPVDEPTHRIMEPLDYGPSNEELETNHQYYNLPTTSVIHMNKIEEPNQKGKIRRKRNKSSRGNSPINAPSLSSISLTKSPKSKESKGLPREPWKNQNPKIKNENFALHKHMTIGNEKNAFKNSEDALDLPGLTQTGGFVKYLESPGAKNKCKSQVSNSRFKSRSGRKDENKQHIHQEKGSLSHNNKNNNQTNALLSKENSETSIVCSKARSFIDEELKKSNSKESEVCDNNNYNNKNTKKGVIEIDRANSNFQNTESSIQIHNNVQLNTSRIGIKQKGIKEAAPQNEHAPLHYTTPGNFNTNNYLNTTNNKKETEDISDTSITYYHNPSFYTNENCRHYPGSSSRIVDLPVNSKISVREGCDPQPDLVSFISEKFSSTRIGDHQGTSNIINNMAEPKEVFIQSTPLIEGVDTMDTMDHRMDASLHSKSAVPFESKYVKKSKSQGSSSQAPPSILKNKMPTERDQTATSAKGSSHSSSKATLKKRQSVISEKLAEMFSSEPKSSKSSDSRSKSIESAKSTKAYVPKTNIREYQDFYDFVGHDNLKRFRFVESDDESYIEEIVFEDSKDGLGKETHTRKHSITTRARRSTSNSKSKSSSSRSWFIKAKNRLSNNQVVNGGLAIPLRHCACESSSTTAPATDKQGGRRGSIVEPYDKDTIKGANSEQSMSQMLYQILPEYTLSYPILHVPQHFRRAPKRHKKCKAICQSQGQRDLYF